jgi:hypothetical protein
VWLGEIPLRPTFPRLYEYSSCKDCLVSDCFVDEGWIINFNRPLGHEEMQEWETLRLQLQLDEVTVRKNRYMYRLLAFGGVINTRQEKLCKSKLPIKLKVFMWLEYHT